MPTAASFRLSTYLTLALACACLGYAEFSILPEAGFFAIAAIVALAVIYRLETRVTLLSIPDANKLGAGILLMSLLWAGYRVVREARLHEYAAVGQQYLFVVLAGPILMTAIPAKLLRAEKHVGDYWTFHVIGLFTVILAGAMAEDAIGLALLMVYAVCAVWSLSLFLQARTTGLVAPIPARPAHEPARSVTLDVPVHKPRISPSLLWTALAAAAAVPLFLATPRSTFAPLELGKPRIEIGYAADQTLDLNRTGTLQPNPEPAFEVAAANDDGTPKLDLSTNQRWRGSVMVEYRAGSWRRTTAQFTFPRVRWTALGSGPWEPPQLGPGRYQLTFAVPAKLRTHVVADPIAWTAGQPVPIAALEPAGPRPWVAATDGSFIAPGLAPLSGTRTHRYMQYFRSADEPDLGPAFELAEPLDVDDPLRQRSLVSNPVPRVKEYADALLHRLIGEGKLPAEARPTANAEGRDRARLLPPPEFHEVIARAFSAHLAGTTDLEYTTHLRRDNKGMDPVEEFLFHSQAGHCERFAAALVLLLRSQGIPSVLVLGFKGCEAVGEGQYVVRQEHAHAWAEALISRPPRPSPTPGPPPRVWHWLSLDPSPVAEAADGTSSVAGWWSRTTAAIERYLFHYTPEERDRSLRTAAGLLTRPEFLGTLVGLLALTAIARRFRGRGGAAPAEPSPASTRWFGRLLAVLAAHGFVPEIGQTPREFAAVVGESLLVRPTTAPLATVPAEWVEEYYAARFGGTPVAADRRAALESRLEDLRRALTNF